MNRILRWLPWYCFGVAALLLVLDATYWHPGFSYFDEGNGCVAQIQLWREGGYPMPFVIGFGSIHRVLVALSTLLSGPTLWAWRGWNLLALLLECLLLARIARRIGGEDAATGALLFVLCSALTLVRLRSLLCYSVVPLELLLLVELRAKARGSAMALLWGALAAFFWFDYEGWSIALLILAALILVQPAERPKLWPALIGFLAILALLFWQSRDIMGTQALLRGRMLSAGWLPAFTENLKALFLGSWAYGYMAVSRHPILPPWAWAFLALGISVAWRRHELRWLLLWSAIGLLPLALKGTAAGSNRLITAWPALALLAGLGWASLMERLEAPRSRLLLALAVILIAGAWESAAYATSMREQYPVYYAESAAMIEAAQKQKEPADLISELDNESSAMWRFVLPSTGAARRSGQGRILALVPREYSRTMDAAPRQLVEVSEKDAVRLRAVADEALALRKALPLGYVKQRRAQLVAYLEAHPKLDPWLRSMLLENAIGLSKMVGDLPPELLREALLAPLQSASAPLWLAPEARQSGDEALARRLEARAKAIDARLAGAGPGLSRP